MWNACVFPFDAEAEAQKRYRTADVSRRREAETSVVFLWPHAASPETPLGSRTPPAPTSPRPSVTSWLSSPFPSKVSIRRVRKENHSLNTNSWGRAGVGEGSVGVCGHMKITFSTRAGEPGDIYSLPPWAAFPMDISWQVVDEPFLPVCTLDSPVMELALLRSLLKLLLETVVLWLLCWLSVFPFLSGCLPLLASIPIFKWPQICTSSPGLCLKYHPSLMEVPSEPYIWRFPPKHSSLHELCGPGNSTSCPVATWTGSMSMMERVSVWPIRFAVQQK